MSIHVNVGGQNKKTSSSWMKINGEWEKGTFWNNVQGVWKKHSYSGFKYLASIVKGTSSIPRKIMLFEPKTKTIIADTPIVSSSFLAYKSTTFYNPYSNTILGNASNTVGQFIEVDLTGKTMVATPVISNCGSNPTIYAALSPTRYIVGYAGGVNAYLRIIDISTGTVIKSRDFNISNLGTYTPIAQVDKLNNKIHLIIPYKDSDIDTGKTFSSNSYTQLDLDFNTIIPPVSINAYSAEVNFRGLCIVPGGCIVVSGRTVQFYPNTGTPTVLPTLPTIPTNNTVVSYTGLPDGNWLELVNEYRTGPIHVCTLSKYSVNGTLLLSNSFQYQGGTLDRTNVLDEVVVLDKDTILLRKDYKDVAVTTNAYYAVVALKDLSLIKLNTDSFFVKDNYTDMYGYYPNNGNLFANPETF